MTIKEFNEKYKVNALVNAVQDIDQITSDAVVYGSIEDILENVNYSVYDRETNQEVFLYEGATDDMFLEALFEEFDIKEG